MNKRNFFLSVLTVFVQYYDYHLFGFLAAKIATHFFPDGEIIIQLLNAYFLMAIAMVAKPIGAIIFGEIGDRKGRSNSFTIGLLGTAIASFILFVTPSHESIGLFSAFLLLLCRMSICAFVSSGSDGVRIYVYEHLEKKRQCLGIGVTTFFTQAGSLAASVSAWFFTLNDMPEYSWKFAFLLGSVMSIIVLTIMKLNNLKDSERVSDNPEFKKYKYQPLTQIIGSNWKLFILCTITAGSIGSTNQFFIIFFGTYNFKILRTIDPSLMQYYISIALVIYMIVSVVSGYLADKIGRYKISIFASLAVLLFALVQCFVLSKNETNPYLFLVMVATLPFLTMPAAAILKESIPVVIRYRVFSLSHAIGSIIISAPTAFISTLLYHKTKIAWLPMCYFIASILIISFALYKLDEKNRQSHEYKNFIR